MAAANHFDPYHKWLGIPPDEQPPNHYRLLGIRVFEADPDVIQSAADQRMAHVRTFQIGANAELSQKLLNELAAARVCLLKAERKAAYDAELKRKLAPKTASATASSPDSPKTTPAAAAPQPQAIPVAAPARTTTAAANHGGIDVDLGIEPPTYRRRRKKQTDQGPLIMMGIIGVLIVGGLVVGLALMQGESQPASPKVARKSPPLQADPPRPHENKPDADPSPQPASPEVTPVVTPVEPPAPVITEPPRIPVSDPPKVGAAAPAVPSRATGLRTEPLMIDDQDNTGFHLVGDNWEFVARTGAFINGAHRAHPPGAGKSAAVWTFGGLEPGKQYTVLATWNPHEIHTTRAPYRISGIAGMDSYIAYVNQAIPPRPNLVESGLPFQELALVTCASGTISVRLLEQDDNYVVADAVMLIAGKLDRPTEVADEVPLVLPQPVPAVQQPPGPSPQATGQAVDKKRLPVPTEEAQKKYRKLVEEVFVLDFRKATTKTTKTELAQALLAQADKSQDDAERYVLFDEARKLAVSAGNAQCAHNIVQQMSYRYELDVSNAHAVLVEDLARLGADMIGREDLTDNIQFFAHDAVRLENYDAALRMLAIGHDVAKNSGRASLISDIAACRTKVEEQAKAFAAACRANEVLKESPEDPDAELAIGKYHCLYRRYWAGGLKHLAKGSDPKLAEIAVLDIGNPTAPEDRLKLADRWAILAEHAEGLERASMLDRAADWCRRAGDQLSGLAQTKARQRLKELTSGLALAPLDDHETAHMPDSKTLAKKIKDAIKRNNLTRTAIYGTASSPRYFFTDVPSAPMLMVGMNYVVMPGTRVIAVQPIYAGVKERTLGGWHGADARQGVVGQSVAPAGYAVGGVETLGTAYTTGFKIIYMKITKSGLDPNDTRVTPLIGVDYGDMVTNTLGGDGRPVVGLFGSIRPGADLGGFGLIQIGK